MEVRDIFYDIFGGAEGTLLGELLAWSERLKRMGEALRRAAPLLCSIHGAEMFEETYSELRKLAEKVGEFEFLMIDLQEPIAGLIIWILDEIKRKIPPL